MTADSAISTPRSCGECGRSIEYAHKVHLGVPICSTCYARMFKNRTCVECGGPVRALARDPNPVCTKCENAKRVCVRCERPVPKAGMIFQGKPVCSSCAPYFREPKRCPRCDRLSTRFSRVIGVTDVAVCNRCQRELTCATCSVCGKHRVRFSVTAEGKPLCRKCTENPDATHLCPDCGTTVGGSTNSPCFKCSMIRSLRKKAKALERSLATSQGKELLEGFAEWAIERDKVNKALSKIAMAADMIARLEHASGGEGALSSDLFRNTFTTEEIRVGGLFSMYLAEIGILTDSATRRSEISDQRRIDGLLRDANDKPWGNLIAKYSEYLNSPEKKIQIRTKRVYLRAAFELIDFVDVADVKEMTQEQVRSFLRRRPGHQASLYPCLHFLRTIGVKVPALQRRNESKGASVQAVARSAREQLEVLQSTNSMRIRRALIAELLSILYGIPLKVVLHLERRDCLISGSDVQLRLQDEWIRICDPIGKHLIKLLSYSGSDVEHSQKLFGGRVLGDALSTSAVSYHVIRSKAMLISSI